MSDNTLFQSICDANKLLVNINQCLEQGQVSEAENGALLALKDNIQKTLSLAPAVEKEKHGLPKHNRGV